MNNLLLYCGLVDAKIRASDKDLPVQQSLGVQVVGVGVESYLVLQILLTEYQMSSTHHLFPLK